MFETFEHGIAPHQEGTDATAPRQFPFAACRDMDRQYRASRVLTSPRFLPLQATGGGIVMFATRILSISQKYQ
jgi:hypothetical protein